MNWIRCLSEAIDHIERHLTDEINLEEIAARSYSSASHFQLIFHLVTGMTVGEYIRSRRLSSAARDLLQPGAKIIDVAMRYRYDAQESFSKAFARFHGIPPSKARRGNVKTFNPLSFKITVQGGFEMPLNFTNEFHLVDWKEIGGQKNGELSDEEKYGRLAEWAGNARGRNPGVFDALTEWILDDSEWGEDKLAENEQILMQGFFARFKAQNAELRAFLKELEPSGVVNEAVFKALDRFDGELSGVSKDENLREAVASMFADFSVMKKRETRARIAGQKTGPAGVNAVEIFGYVNYLKDCDAGVQWALFMPDAVEKQQKGFKIESFDYIKAPAMRFVGKEADDSTEDLENRRELFRVFDKMSEYKSGWDCDVLFMHHYGLCVDVGPWHGFWGRFMKADAPVPEGYLHFDFVPQMGDSTVSAGPPFLSQFAYAVFSGDDEALHKQEGYDSDAMYDVTRNTMLGQGVNIPYPNKYWTAEVFPNGCDKPSTEYMFSADF